MKYLLILIFMTAKSAMATSDSNEEFFIPVEHIQSGEFFIQKVPVIACFGLPQGFSLMGLTSEYKVPSNIGCGQTMDSNINALSCAKLISAEENSSYMGFSKITLDISGCPKKHNLEFLSAVRKVVKLNFVNKSNPSVDLQLKYE